MPRVGDTFVLPPDTAAISGEVAAPADLNARFDDLAADANAVRPVSKGGTGRNTLAALYSDLGLKTLAKKDTVGTDDILDDAITTGKLLDGAVTTEKIAEGVVAALLGIGPRVSYRAATATVLRAVGATGVSRLAEGKYRVTLTDAQPDATYDVVAQNMQVSAVPAGLFANVNSRTTTTFEVWTGYVDAGAEVFRDHDFFAEVRR